MAILTLDQYKDYNPRFEGMKLLHQVLSNASLSHISMPNTRIVDFDAFHQYLKQGDFAEPDLKEMKKTMAALLKISNTGALTVRRAFLVPGLQSPPGPRFLGLRTIDEAIQAVKAVFDFAIENNYYQKDGSRIEAFYYPFVDPPKFNVPLESDANLPKGGYAYAATPDGKIVKMLAVWGNNEGVQSLGNTDEYTVDAENLIILKKDIVQKEFGLFTTPHAQDDKLQVPLNKQFQQVLNDIEILELAIVVRECTRIATAQKRVEYSYTGTTLAVNEVIDHDVNEQPQYDDLLIEGQIYTIENKGDIAGLDGNEAKRIVYLSNKIVEKRDYGTLNAVAAHPTQLNVLYPGTTATAHAMRVLTDAGHRAFIVGDRQFKDKEEVQIQVVDGEIVVRTKGDIVKSDIVSLHNAYSFNVDEVGGKAYNLSRLIQLGFKVPNGFVIKSGVMDDNSFFEHDDFLRFLHELDEKKLYSVRSSANVEDSINNALAGQFETVINVKRGNIIQAIIKVWKSARKAHLQKVVEGMGVDKIKMAVVIQDMVHPSYAGVMFGANILTKNLKEVLLEVTAGYAEQVVEGLAEAIQVVFDKETGRVKRKSGKEVEISDVMLDALYQMYLRVEGEFQNIQDVEWTYDKGGNLYLLQTRDLKI